MNAPGDSTRTENAAAKDRAVATCVPVGVLEAFVREAMPAMGVPEEYADIWTDALLTASLRSLPGQGQGVQRLPVYFDRIERGVIRVDAELEIVRRRGSVLLTDANDGIGPVMAVKAMELAVNLAAERGVGCVGVRGGTHFGVAAYYSMLAAKRGSIGMIFSNSAPELAPWGGTRATLGTNPWSVALPNEQDWKIVLDMANSTSGKGMIDWHRRQSLPIPDDWALTAEGRRTTDPVAAMAGTLFPLGGAKGYAMSVVVDAITGVLTGATFGLECSDPDHQDLGHLLIAIDVDAFMDLGTYQSRLTRLIDEIQSAPRAEGCERIYLPGELEYLREQERRINGIPVGNPELRGLLDFGETLGIDTTLTEQVDTA
jgi:LDH2 family malate/lactate/ureidoglycolate dehydrogenase